MKKILVMLLLASPTYAGVSVNNISIKNITSNAVQIFYTSSNTTTANTYDTVFFATTTESGVYSAYPYTSITVYCHNVGGAVCNTVPGPGSISLGGLAPGVTYYFLLTVRPDSADFTGMCSTSGCGTSEMSFVTPNTPQNIPNIIAPTTWTFVNPDSTNYIHIPVIPDPTTGVCESGVTVSSSGWTVHSGDSLETIMTEITTYGISFDLDPHNAPCLPNVYNSSTFPNYYGGVDLPSLALDNFCGGTCTMTDPRHRWIIFETTSPVTSQPLPAYGSRTGPQYAPALGKMCTDAPRVDNQFFNGNQATTAIHHILWRNIELEVCPSYVQPAAVDYLQPPLFQCFMELQLGGFQTQQDQFLVWDRVYSHAPGDPVRWLKGYQIAGNYIGWFGDYMDGVEVWTLFKTPFNTGSIDGTSKVITAPPETFAVQGTDSLMGQMSTATITITGVSGGMSAPNNQIYGMLSKTGLTVYTVNATATCSGCLAVVSTTTVWSSLAVGPMLQSWLVYVDSTAATGTIQQWNNQFYSNDPTEDGLAFGILPTDGVIANNGPYMFDNNYFDGVGEGFYIDPGERFSNDDITWTHNHEIWPKQFNDQDPNHTYTHHVRQHWESKRSQRGLIKGNMFSYYYGYQNDGPAVFISGRPTYMTISTATTGLLNFEVVSNLMSHGVDGIDSQGSDGMGNNDGGAQNELAGNLLIHNNLMFDFNKFYYCSLQNCPSVFSTDFLIPPGMQQVYIDSNTMGPTYGYLPAIDYGNAGLGVGSYFEFKNNIAFFSHGTTNAADGGYGVNQDSQSVLGNFLHFTPTWQYLFNSTSPDFKTALNTSFVKITTATVAPNWGWSGNIIIGGTYPTGAGNTTAEQIDWPYAAMSTYALNMPSGDYYPLGDTIATREAAIGFSTTTWVSVSSPTVGANITQLYQDMGRVENVSTSVSNTTGILRYHAPDTRACTTDFSFDGGTTWPTRFTDAGGASSRVATVSGSASQTINYRLQCYYFQQNDGVLYTDYTPSETTVGSFQLLGPSSGDQSWKGGVKLKGGAKLK